MSSSATTSATSASPENADQNSADQRLTTKRKIDANETDARKKARGEAKIKLNDDSQEIYGKRKFEKEFSFSYDSLHSKGCCYDKKYLTLKTDVIYGDSEPMDPRDIFAYDETHADHPQIVWDSEDWDDVVCYNDGTGMPREFVIKDAKQTILNDILTHLSEDKSVTICDWSDDCEIPLTMNEFNAGLMSPHEIYESIYGRSKSSIPRNKNGNNLKIVKCTAEPFLGCYIICDGRRGDKVGGVRHRINRMASHFLKNQVIEGEIYGDVILTRTTTNLGERRPAYNETDRNRVPEMPEWMKYFIKRYGGMGEGNYKKNKETHENKYRY